MKLATSLLLMGFALSSLGQAKEEILTRVKEVQESIEARSPETQLKLDSLGMDIGSFSKRWLSSRNADVLIHYYQASVEYWAYLNTTFPTNPLPFSDLSIFIGEAIPKELPQQIHQFEKTNPTAKGVRSSVDNLVKNTAAIAKTTWSLDSAKTKYFENISVNIVKVQTQLAALNENMEKSLEYQYSLDSLMHLQHLKRLESLQRSAYLILVHKFQKQE